MAITTALIGIGAMGKALLGRLQQAGCTVRAYDIAAAGLEAARAAGAETLASPAEAARGAAFIHVIVASDQDVETACLGPGGVLEGAAPDAILFLHSTILPATTKRVAEAAVKREVAVLDATVTAVPARVADGAAVFLVGGDKALVDHVRPHLLSLGREVQHFGPLGAGNVAKLAKNMINAAERVLYDEALKLTEAGGIDARQFLETMQRADQGSFVLRWEKCFTVEGTHAEPRPATNLFNKDVQLAARFAEMSRLDLPIAQGAAATAVRWVKKGAAQKA
jgi:3-hydroxyisobutyrate dehydrogenase-like beta-hydroxyacid dehydrogenase